MKTVQAISLVLVVFAACASAFAPQHVASRPSFTARAMSKSIDDVPQEKSNAAALAAFATAMAPLASFAELDVPDIPSEVSEVVEATTEAATQVAAVAASSGVDEAVLIGYGAGLVACVTFFAVGFSIGYGALVKP
mmetsp:Transcript_26190/g.53652  ORF Transcript_26190/g.53652 Transcript_26190/m.53652 type:complete len:136 (-) Transcript_26190:178-585(-)|eukprot:CAMPEP_0183306850 /NCGR_PEP_ID=MMETSP0160_2-20130417/14953_1 /TAXON_ID=2839 ORGANISM="Odontella Sinensis, Strain Grunow 1884" /NCGR_SAMPLE_ID=MMETSP0160_2 /ASSEMBLY_ACC=CAM_ASM_000250 /LENGTH=135 /DNA_ID=CAMNT_0025470317 /DNA_START=121 /DNA_END=528 /DNA_ORIENTATION=-